MKASLLNRHDYMTLRGTDASGLRMNLTMGRYGSKCSATIPKGADVARIERLNTRVMDAYDAREREVFAPGAPEHYTRGMFFADLLDVARVSSDFDDFAARIATFTPRVDDAWETRIKK